MDIIDKTGADIILISEPYISRKTDRIPGVTPEFVQYHKGYGSLSAIIIKKTIPHFKKTEWETEKLTTIAISNARNEKILISSIYCPRNEPPIINEVRNLPVNSESSWRARF